MRITGEQVRSGGDIRQAFRLIGVEHGEELVIFQRMIVLTMRDGAAVDAI